MATFVLCDACCREYENPHDRRFHGEPDACPECGPPVHLVLRATCCAIAAGCIVAIKGAGGFGLATDATDERPVPGLCERKRQPDKPFAVMGRSLDDLDRIVELDADATVLVASRARPIVLVPAGPVCSRRRRSSACRRGRDDRYRRRCAQERQPRTAPANEVGERAAEHADPSTLCVQPIAKIRRIN
jgi:hydrogenase maturation factor HypF (carbamoyltransferase family)